GAAGSTDLDEGELFTVRGLLFEKPFDAAKPLWDALCVVHAIDAQSEEGSLDSQLPTQVRTAGGSARGFGSGGVFPVEGHADGERLHAGQMLAAIDGEVFPIDA